MGRLYLLFKTDEFVVKDIVAVHESLEFLLTLLKNNHELAEPKRLGQGWEIDLMTYDDTGKANLTLVNKFKKELVNCRQNDIQEGCYYNIIYKNKDGHDYKCLCKTRGIGKTKCIKSNPPEYIFGNREATGLQLNYDDIFIITKCREDEDDEDWDRFQYYSNVLQCKMSLVDSK